MFRVTFLGHQGFLLSAGGTHVLIDPLIGDRFGNGPPYDLLSIYPHAIGRHRTPSGRGRPVRRRGADLRDQPVRDLFSVIVLMALVTTLMTSPLVLWLLRDANRQPSTRA